MSGLSHLDHTLDPGFKDIGLVYASLPTSTYVQYWTADLGAP